MTKYLIALLAGAAFLSPPLNASAIAADGEATVETLQAQIRSIQQQLDALKQAAPAKTPVQASAPKVAENAAHKLSLESADGLYSIAVTGVVQADVGGYVNFAPASAVSGPQHLTSGFNVRRARIGVAGKVFGDWTYKFIYDGGNSQDTTPSGIEAAQVSYTGFKGAIIDLPGYSATPFTLEQATSSGDLMFLERSTPTNVAIGFNAGDSRSNTGIRLFGDRYWVGAYFSGPASGDSHTNVSERFGAFQRATYQLVSTPELTVHLGIAIDELLNAPNSGVGTAQAISLSDRPELRIDPTSLLSTGTLGTVANPVTGGLVLTAEAAAGWKNLFAQGELFHYAVDRRGLAAAHFDGGYAQVSWVLTGEHRGYDRATGAYTGIVPAHPFSRSKGGIGAWEVAARVSVIDLTDHFVAGTPIASQPNAVNGGRQVNTTVGLNWYPNSLMRVMVNYVHTSLSKANGAAVTGAGLGVPVGASADAIAARIQFSY